MSEIERLGTALRAELPIGYGMNAKEAERLVRAVLQAMREPSEEMAVAGLIGLCTKIERMHERFRPTEGQLKGTEPMTEEQAANYHMNVGAIMRNGQEVSACWQAMIDAALREEVPA